MNIAACALTAACSAAVAARIVGGPVVLDAVAPEAFGNPVELLSSAQVEGSSFAATASWCETIEMNLCPREPLAQIVASPEDPGSVFVLPAPTGDPAKDLAVLQNAVKNSKYAAIDGANGTQRQVYTIKGMLQVDRSIAIRNLEIKQLDDDYVVRTIYAAGGGTPITLRLENIKIERGPENSGATGSVSDSAGIWTTNTKPEFRNIEIYGGGKGDGILIHNATGGYLTDIYVHDITWTPYVEDQQDPTFWNGYTLASLQKAANWNGFTIHDFDGRVLSKKRVEEQVYGIVLNNVYDLDVVRPRIERLRTRFSDGQLYPYQSDGITVVSGNDITIQDAIISHVAEGIDVPGFPAAGIDIVNTTVSDAPLFCFKTRGSYDVRAVKTSADDPHVTFRKSVGKRCGIAAFTVAGGGEAVLSDTQAIDTGLGPDGSAAPGIGTVAAYRFNKSAALPTLEGQSVAIGMKIINATVSNPNSKVMQMTFLSENDPKDQRTYSLARNYSINNPAKPDLKVSQNFTVVENVAAQTIPTTTQVAAVQ